MCGTEDIPRSFTVPAKAPPIGKRIAHTMPSLDPDEVREGVVYLHLASQFCYECDDGSTGMCHYDGTWKYA